MYLFNKIVDVFYIVCEYYGVIKCEWLKKKIWLMICKCRYFIKLSRFL